MISSPTDSGWETIMATNQESDFLNDVHKVVTVLESVRLTANNRASIDDLAERIVELLKGLG